MPSIKDEIKKNRSRIVRRLLIKRRLKSTGLFEADFTDISSDVKKWGTLTKTVDSERKNTFQQGGLKIQLANDDGRYNDESDPSSLWFGFASRQRTLVKVECAFVDYTTTSGITTIVEWPPGPSPLWDESKWNEALWDPLSSASPAAVYVGLLTGDMPANLKNTITLPIVPLSEVFRQFPAKNLTGWTSTGFTAENFVNTMVRDQTAGAGNFIFRPFFGDTTTNWVVSSTTAVMANLNTSGAQDVVDRNVWQVLQKLAEAEGFIPTISREGKFTFGPANPGSTGTAAYDFFGVDILNTDFGHTIKDIKRFGPRHTKFYSRVELKWKEANTETSLEIKEASLTVSGSNSVWNLGYRTFSFENLFIASNSIATQVVENVFADTSAMKREIDFSTSFIPQLDVLDFIRITFDNSGEVEVDSLG